MDSSRLLPIPRERGIATNWKCTYMGVSHHTIKSRITNYILEDDHKIVPHLNEIKNKNWPRVCWNLPQRNSLSLIVYCLRAGFGPFGLDSRPCDPLRNPEILNLTSLLCKEIPIVDFRRNQILSEVFEMSKNFFIIFWASPFKGAKLIAAFVWISEVLKQKSNSFCENPQRAGK